MITFLKGVRMASNVKQTRVQQKQRFLRLLAERKAALMAQGASEEKIRKDRAVKHLLAEIKRTSRAIASVDARENIINTAKLQRQERAAQIAETPKAKKGKQKVAPAAAKEGKKEKKQKQKPAEE
jgi:hypothetical protein